MKALLLGFAVAIILLAVLCAGDIAALVGVLP
jgi:hypothetical protein